MTSDFTRGLALLAAISGAGALLLWVAVLVREWPRLLAAGTLCGDHGGSFHCAACYAAAALAAVALTAAAGVVRLEAADKAAV